MHQKTDRLVRRSAWKSGCQKSKGFTVDIFRPKAYRDARNRWVVTLRQLMMQRYRAALKKSLNF